MLDVTFYKNDDANIINLPENVYRLLANNGIGYKFEYVDKTVAVDGDTYVENVLVLTPSNRTICVSIVNGILLNVPKDDVSTVTMFNTLIGEFKNKENNYFSY